MGRLLVRCKCTCCTYMDICSYLCAWSVHRKRQHQLAEAFDRQLSRSACRKQQMGAACPASHFAICHVWQLVSALISAASPSFVATATHVGLMTAAAALCLPALSFQLPASSGTMTTPTTTTAATTIARCGGNSCICNGDADI